MGILLTSDDVRRQSEQVWAQFGERLWIPNSEENCKIPRGNTQKLEHTGVGKVAVMCAMGSSLERHIGAIKKYRDRVDVICCDKAFVPLLEHGVKADYVVVADAGIPFHHIEKRRRDTKDVVLLSTPYASPVWVRMWEGPRYFYVNKDAIESEKIFKKYFHTDIRVIPASSNVSNAMLVFWTDCEGRRNENWGGYEKYLLVGYDYSWPVFGNYYAWNDVKPKRYYMNHRTFIDLQDTVVFTSENLLFSAKWLYSYVTTFQLPVYNCCEQGILDIPLKSNLEKELSRISPNRKARDAVRSSFDTYKNSFHNYKKQERNFYDLKEALLWQ